MAAREGEVTRLMANKRAYVLNGRRMDTREHAHAHIKRRLRLPDWYGNNLDALCDCLGEINEPSVILVRYATTLREALGEYGGKLLSVLSAMTGENPNITLVVHKKF